jgi:hypothetical protein
LTRFAHWSEYRDQGQDQNRLEIGFRGPADRASARRWSHATVYPFLDPPSPKDTEQGGAEVPIEKFTGNPGSFRDELRNRGYVVGKNLLVDLRTAQGDVSKLPALAEALVANQRVRGVEL